MGIILSLSKDRQGHANFRGDFATNFCELSLAEGKVKKIDDITIALYGYFDSCEVGDRNPAEFDKVCECFFGGL